MSEEDGDKFYYEVIRRIEADQPEASEDLKQAIFAEIWQRLQNDTKEDAGKPEERSTAPKA